MINLLMFLTGVFTALYLCKIYVLFLHSPVLYDFDRGTCTERESFLAETWRVWVQELWRWDEDGNNSCGDRVRMGKIRWEWGQYLF